MTHSVVAQKLARILNNQKKEKAMFSIKELKETCFIPMGRYSLKMLAPKGTPEHVIEFIAQNGVLRAQVTTEHGEQEAENITFSGGVVTWRQYGGTSGTELFEYKMKLYAGDVMLGEAYRVDVDESESLESPMVAEKIIEEV